MQKRVNRRVISLFILLWFGIVILNGCYPFLPQPTFDEGSIIIGVIETVTVYAKDGQHYKEIQAKIDTGADSSSIDEQLAEQLGFTDALSYYHSFGVDKMMSETEIKVVKQSQVKLKLESHPDIVKVVTVRSAHGATYRIKIPLLFYLAGVKLKTQVTVADRKNLKYPMIIGRRDLDGFLVDPNEGR